jgi:hypothetical protein
MTVVRTIRMIAPAIVLAAAACAPATLPLREDASSAASTAAPEAPPPELPRLTESRSTAAQPAAASAPIYTCSMHPEVRVSQPGKCPSCGMTLDRVEERP